MNKFSGLSSAALQANINYANATGNHQLASDNIQARIMPIVDARIKQWNAAITATNNKLLRNQDEH